MADTRFGNFHSCCRLCLSEKPETLKSVFDDSISHQALPQRILQFVAVEINANDKVSTMVCNDCVNKLNNWHAFRQECGENQNKLEHWMNMCTTTASEVAEMTFQIKEEPVCEGEETADISQNTNGSLPIKIEPMDEHFNDFPPPLTPQGNFSEDSQDSQSSSITTDTNDNVDKRKCSMCDKVFFSAGNRKKHEKQIHGKNRISPPTFVIDIGRRSQMNEISSTSDNMKNVTEGSVSQDEGSQNSVDSQSGLLTLTENPPPDSDQQKIQFAAGLKLLQTNSTPISCEPLSKIELSYIEKCKAMVNMHKTLECACHNVQHPNLKGLLSHLRALRIWFPVFTCYSCMISFSDRSTFTKHHGKCPKTQLESLIQLSNLRKRSKVKTRLYQNYKCTSCKFMYSFHDEFCKHVDEEHAIGEAPFTCSCTRTFSDVEDYKDHIYVSCLVEYYCDICFITVKTLDAFQKHAQEVHDNSEGFILLQDDNYKVRKSFVRENTEESLVITGKRERRQSVKAPIVDDDFDYIPAKVLNPSSVRTSPSKAPTKCPICYREYSNYHNMLRHYRSHMENNTATGTSGAQSDDIDNSYYSCPDCGGMYKTLDWIQHLQQVHESKNCGECGKMFQFQTELDQHRSVHLNLKVYRDSKTQAYKSTMLSPNEEGEIMVMCEICDTMFATKEELKVHKLSHETGMETAAEEAKPLTNDPSETIELIKEIKQEVKEGKYQCVPCNKNYISYGGLWDHNKKKHPDKKPHSDFPKKCDYCDKMCSTGASLFSHKQMHERMTLGDFQKVKPAPVKARKSSTVEEDDDESYHTCKRCFKVFSSKFNLKMHMRSHGLSLNKNPIGKKIVKKVWCDICHVACDSLEILEKHKEEHKSNPNLEEMPNLNDDEEIEEESKGFVYTCNVCVMTFPSKMLLKKHKEIHSEDVKPVIPKAANSSVYCKYCKIAFSNVMELTKHMHVEHGESAKPKFVKEKEKPKTFRCQICKKPFSTMGAMNAHFGWHKRNKPTSVKVLKNMSRASDTAASVQPPMKPSEFQCITCLAELPNDTALQIHILEKHRSVNAIMLIPRCNTCNQDFATQDEYETHKRFHDFLERQKQHEMQMKNQSPSLVQSPLNVAQQNQKKNFPCHYCKALFSRSDTLNTHMKQHHKEYVQTEFKCNQCDRVFDKQNSLSIHLKVHEKQKTNGPAGKPLFSCSICNMGFNLPKDLRMHTINAHPF